MAYKLLGYDVEDKERLPPFLKHFLDTIGGGKVLDEEILTELSFMLFERGINNIDDLKNLSDLKSISYELGFKRGRLGSQRFFSKELREHSDSVRRFVSYAAAHGFDVATNMKVIEESYKRRKEITNPDKYFSRLKDKILGKTDYSAVIDNTLEDVLAEEINDLEKPEKAGPVYKVLDFGASSPGDAVKDILDDVFPEQGVINERTIITPRDLEDVGIVDDEPLDLDSLFEDERDEMVAGLKTSDKEMETADTDSLFSADELAEPALSDELVHTDDDSGISSEKPSQVKYGRTETIELEDRDIEGEASSDTIAELSAAGVTDQDGVPLSEEVRPAAITQELSLADIEVVGETIIDQDKIETPEPEPSKDKKGETVEPEYKWTDDSDFESGNNLVTNEGITSVGTGSEESRTAGINSTSTESTEDITLLGYNIEDLLEREDYLGYFVQALNAIEGLDIYDSDVRREIEEHVPKIKHLKGNTFRRSVLEHFIDTYGEPSGDFEEFQPENSKNGRIKKSRWKKYFLATVLGSSILGLIGLGGIYRYQKRVPDPINISNSDPVPVPPTVKTSIEKVSDVAPAPPVSDPDEESDSTDDLETKVDNFYLSVEGKEIRDEEGRMTVDAVTGEKISVSFGNRRHSSPPETKKKNPDGNYVRFIPENIDEINSDSYAVAIQSPGKYKLILNTEINEGVYGDIDVDTDVLYLNIKDREPSKLSAPEPEAESDTSAPTNNTSKDYTVYSPTPEQRRILSDTYNGFDKKSKCEGEPPSGVKFEVEAENGRARTVAVYPLTGNLDCEDFKADLRSVVARWIYNKDDEGLEGKLRFVWQ